MTKSWLWFGLQPTLVFNYPTTSHPENNLLDSRLDVGDSLVIHVVIQRQIATARLFPRLLEGTTYQATLHQIP